MFDENAQVYGVRKVWHQSKRESFEVARCTVERSMWKMGLEGVIRCKRVRTAVPEKATPCPLDHVNRQFRVPRPNELWVSDVTDVAAWQDFVYVAFVIDVFARRIIGWRVLLSAPAGFVLDALEQGLPRLQTCLRRRPRARLGSRRVVRLDQVHGACCRSWARAICQQRRL